MSHELLTEFEGALRVTQADAALLPNADPARPEGPRRTVDAVVIALDSVEPEHVEWLWPGRLPKGKVVVLDGEPAVGKSTLAVDLAARVTVGGTWPDGAAGRSPASVVLLSGEDGLSDTVRPRLDAAGADASRVHAITGVMIVDAERGTQTNQLSIPGDLDVIERVVREHHARLVVVDVLMAYLSADANSYRDQDVRRALAPLAAMADRTDCCVVLLRHPRKGAAGSAIDAGGGSIGIIGLARVGLVAALDPDDVDVTDSNDPRRVLAVSKCNIGKTATSLAYRIVDCEGVGRIEWLGESGLRADDLFDRYTRDVDRRDKEGFLLDLLRDGAVPAKDVEARARAAGWSTSALRETFRKLGGKSVKMGFDRGWAWTLRPEGTEDDPGQVRASSSPSAHLRLVDGPPDAEWEDV